MPNRHPIRALLIPLLVAAFLFAGQLPAFASHAGSDAMVHPLAICRDGISFLFWADYYPAGPDNPATTRPPTGSSRSRRPPRSRWPTPTAASPQRPTP
jgi:hypothetical protein